MESSAKRTLNPRRRTQGRMQGTIAVSVSRPAAPIDDEPRAPSRADLHQGTQEELVIEPRRGWIAIDWRELLRYRELLFFLVWRDVKVRYKQAVLGVGWAVLQPALTVAVFTLIFGFAAGFRNTSAIQVPYAIFVFAGMLPWQLFAASLNLGGMSLVNQQHLLTKIYFPRLFVPTAPVGGALLDMAIGFGAFGVLMLCYGAVPAWTIIFLPLLVVLSTMLALGVAYLTAALTVTYRDFRFLIPFAVQIWMWLSFIAFPVPPAIQGSARWTWLFALNPMHGLVSSYRKAIFGARDGGANWSPLYLTTSAVMAVAVFVFGLFYFRRTERRFADVA
jgi:lipopolysaccharide transport system permease protein